MKDESGRMKAKRENFPTCTALTQEKATAPSGPVPSAVDELETWRLALPQLFGNPCRVTAKVENRPNENRAILHFVINGKRESFGMHTVKLSEMDRVDTGEKAKRINLKTGMEPQIYRIYTDKALDWRNFAL